jgi:hypothetical protein
MKLPFIRPAATKEVKAGEADPNAPHHFQEVLPGVVPCALCRNRASDKIHIVEEQGAKWGM